MNLDVSGLDNIFYHDSIALITEYIEQNKAEIIASNQCFFDVLGTLPTNATRIRWDDIHAKRMLHPPRMMYTGVFNDGSIVDYVANVRTLVQEFFVGAAQVFIIEDTFSDNALRIPTALLDDLLSDLLFTPAHKYIFSEDMRFLVNITSEGSVYALDMVSLQGSW